MTDKDRNPNWRPKASIVLESLKNGQPIQIGNYEVFLSDNNMPYFLADHYESNTPEKVDKVALGYPLTLQEFLDYCDTLPEIRLFLKVANNVLKDCLKDALTILTG